MHANKLASRNANGRANANADIRKTWLLRLTDTSNVPLLSANK